MKTRALVWLVTCAVVFAALNGTSHQGWIVGVVVAGVLLLVIPLSVERYRLERRLARMIWGALTGRS